MPLNLLVTHSRSKRELDSLGSKNTIAAVDLFAGPGGLSLGFENAGFDIVAAIECDRDATLTYERNFPETDLIKRKIENVDPDELRDILMRDPRQKVVLIGGPPCQPFSSANRQTNGNSNPQASTVDHFVTFIQHIKPDAFLFENVVSFGYMNKGKSMKIFQKKLKKKGFKTDASVIESEKFEVPQRRRRLFIGGIKKGISRNFKLSPKGNIGEKVTVKDAISDLPLLKDGGGGIEEINYPRRKKLSHYQEEARKGSDRLYNHWCSKNSATVVETMKCIKKGSSLNKSWSSLPESVKSRYKNPDAIHNNIYRRLSWNESSPTIVHARRAMLLHPRINRIITVREAARLQNFSDKFRFYGGIHAQYQQVANAVPPKVAEALAKVLLMYLSKKN